MKSVKFFFLNNLYAIILFIFAVQICQYSGNRGIFPIDSFGHFDSGFRVLNGEHPFKDFWVISGPLIDYLQSLIFFLFGTNWQTYLLSSSLLNGLISLFTYYLLIHFGLNKNLSFFYSLCFSVLAYPSSGTPFVDHHSTFLSMVGLYTLLVAINTNNFFHWFLIPFFMLLAFLSKQVPAAYILLSIIIITFIHLIYQKKKFLFKIIFSLIFSSVFIISLLFIFFKINSIELENFLTQYILYPTSLGSQRYNAISYDFKNVFLNFKFIYISLLILLLLCLKRISNKKKFYKEKSFQIFLINFFLFLSLIQHMIATKNQIYIFFLIPIFLAFAHLQLIKLNIKFKNILSFFLILFCVSITIKYHFRFNVDRKFHELDNINFSNTVRGETIHEKLKGLNWAVPIKHRKIRTNLDINFLKNFFDLLQSDKSRKMIITNYSFFSVLSDQNVSSYSRWYPGDSSAFPKKGDKYYENYKKFIITSIKLRETETIYVLPDVSETNVINYIDANCYKKEEINNKIMKFKINRKCEEFSNQQ